MRTLILGIGGQDGSFMAELLLKEGLEVHGFYRRSSVDNLVRLAGIRDQVTLHQGDLLDPGSIRAALRKSQPDFVFNFADQDHVGFSYAAPYYSSQVTFGGVRNLLNAVTDVCPLAKVFQPLSATMFGDASPPQFIGTTFLNPQSPYASAKRDAWDLCLKRRKDRGLDIRCGVMFNHDSPRRGPDYLLQRLARQAVAVRRGELGRLSVGAPGARVDIGFAGEFVECIWRFMQAPESAPKDVIIGTGQLFMVGTLASVALEEAGLGYNGRDWHPLIEEDASFRHSPECLQAAPSEYNATRYFADDVVRMLVRHHLVSQEGKAYLASRGF